MSDTLHESAAGALLGHWTGEPAGVVAPPWPGADTGSLEAAWRHAADAPRPGASDGPGAPLDFDGGAGAGAAVSPMPAASGVTADDLLAPAPDASAWFDRALGLGELRLGADAARGQAAAALGVAGARARVAVLKIGGIQRFVFRDPQPVDGTGSSSGGRARRLRARSMLVALLGWGVTRSTSWRRSRSSTTTSPPSTWRWNPTTWTR